MVSNAEHVVLDGADRHNYHTDEELIRRWFRQQVNRRPKRGGISLQGKVTAQFCIGSTSARSFCKRHGFDPDAIVRKP